jgi:hypothetical protein
MRSWRGGAERLAQGAGFAAALSGCRSALSCLRTLGLPIKGIVGGEPFGKACNLAAERRELQLHRVIVNFPGAIDDARRRRNRDDIRHRPTTKRANNKLHRVDCL